ncbi:MAG: hypothetical protein ABL994_19175 [Verrucomicrobiales bacterium]
MNGEDDHYYPMINVEETIGKTVGNLKRIDPSRVQRSGRRLYRALGFRVCPPGVYRFNSHEEADAWTMKVAVERALEVDRKAS